MTVEREINSVDNDLKDQVLDVFAPNHLTRTPALVNRFRDLVFVLGVAFFAVLCWKLFTILTVGNAGSVQGQITDLNGEPLPKIAVVLNGTDLQTTTDSEGRFLIPEVTPGTYTLVAQHRSSGILIPLDIHSGDELHLSAISLYAP
jgi:hypothetical protein